MTVSSHFHFPGHLPAFSLARLWHKPGTPAALASVYGAPREPSAQSHGWVEKHKYQNRCKCCTLGCMPAVEATQELGQHRGRREAGGRREEGSGWGRARSHLCVRRLSWTQSAAPTSYIIHSSRVTCEDIHWYGRNQVVVSGC